MRPLLLNLSQQTNRGEATAACRYLLESLDVLGRWKAKESSFEGSLVQSVLVEVERNDITNRLIVLALIGS